MNRQHILVIAGAVVVTAVVAAAAIMRADHRH